MSVALGLFTVASAIAQQTEANAVNSSSYPDSPEGLKALINDVFVALKMDNKARVSELLDNLAIPDYKTWFVKEFGSVEGQRLALRYEETAPQLRFETEKFFNSALSEGRTEITVNALRESANSGTVTLGSVVVKAMQEPVSLYTADGTSPTQKYGLLLGNYFFIQGGFRYVSSRVLQALSTAPPVRIRLGGQVVASKLVHQVQPIYPAEARASRTEGSVVLHAIVGTDGHVKELSLVSGDPALADAAVSAVRQWQYQPVKLNNDPAEVDTTITVTFKMR